MNHMSCFVREDHMRRTFAAAATVALGIGLPAAAEIRIAHVYDRTGALEAYAAQSHVGLMMGLEYATEGTMEINGRSRSSCNRKGYASCDPRSVAPCSRKPMATTTPISRSAQSASGVALAMLPVAEEFERILIVEPAVADSDHRLENWNRYIFRTGRNSSPGRHLKRRSAGARRNVRSPRWRRIMPLDATASQPSARRSMPTGAVLAHEEYVPYRHAPISPPQRERIFDALRAAEGRRRQASCL
jgi:branched-chain amino acid transport system substrate-binding protein